MHDCFPCASRERNTQQSAFLEEVGLSQECQGHVIRAGASCLPEIQSLATGIVMNPDVSALIAPWPVNIPELLQGLNGCFQSDSSAPAGDAAVPGVLAVLDNPAIPLILPVLTQTLIDTTLPMVRQLLPAKDAEGVGVVSGTCCEAVKPVVMDGCLCSKSTMELVHAAIARCGPKVTNLNPVVAYFVQSMDQLKCQAADDLVAWPCCREDSSSPAGWVRRYPADIKMQCEAPAPPPPP